MKRHPKTTSHNYVPLLLTLRVQVAQGSLVLADVRHDDWCDALQGRGFCNCDPVIVVDDRNTLPPREGMS